MNSTNDPVALATAFAQQACTLILIVATVTMVAFTGAAIFGLAPWLTLGVSFGETEIANAGMWAQVGLTALLLMLVGFLPSNARVRQLEVTNRDFHISMEDVARAYDAVHRADREGAFQLSREFDAMRDRIEWMRDHPDLRDLEHDVLELAAQMSVESRDLAQIYSTQKVERAQAFLRQRQQEVEDYRQQISMAQATVQEIRRWMQALSVEEGLAEKQLDRLRKDLADITDAMNLSGAPSKSQNVVGMDPARRKTGEAKAKPAARVKTAKTVPPTRVAASSAALKETPRAMLTSEDEDDDDYDILMHRT